MLKLKMPQIDWDMVFYASITVLICISIFYVHKNPISLNVESIKSLLTLFLQVSAIGVFCATWLPIRKPKLNMASPVVSINFDLAIQEKVYGECHCLEECFNAVWGGKGGDGHRILIGYRSPLRGLDIIKEVSGWSPHPETVFIGETDARIEETRWACDLQHLKRVFDHKGLPVNFKLAQKKITIALSPLRSLEERLRKKYDYRLLDLGPDEKPAALTCHFDDDNHDLFAMLLDSIEKHCLDDKDRVYAFSNLHSATKIVNIIQLKNPYHHSLHNVHLRVTYENRGTMKLVEGFARKEGFEVANNTSQFAHLVLGELPPNSERYCLIETGVTALLDSEVEIQSDMLFKLSPSIMKRIAIIAGSLSLLLLSIFGSS